VGSTPAAAVRGHRSRGRRRHSGYGEARRLAVGESASGGCGAVDWRVERSQSSDLGLGFVRGAGCLALIWQGEGREAKAPLVAGPLAGRAGAAAGPTSGRLLITVPGRASPRACATAQAWPVAACRASPGPETLVPGRTRVGSN